ncbi:MAG: hypothetical protein KAT70_07230 [Thermoplasmata archaeon]|nr:hypothetical protein [Thermoplasmata archaeon]
MSESDEAFYEKRHEVPNLDALPPIKIKAEELPPFPFTAIVGQPRMKKAILLAMANPSIHTVLLMGNRETGKGTTVNSGASLLPADVPFMEMPLNVSRLQLFGGKAKGVLGEIQKKGLVELASGGYLFVERINLFDDGTIGKIMAHTVKSGYTLLGTANLEDGPFPEVFEHNLDLKVEIYSLEDIEERIEILKRLEGYRRDPKGFYQTYNAREEALALKIERARKIVATIEPSKKTRKHVERLCKKAKRPDRIESLMKAANANAALENRTWTDKDDVDEVVKLVLPEA